MAYCPRPGITEGRHGSAFELRSLHRQDSPDTNASEDTVRQWIVRYGAYGVDGLHDRLAVGGLRSFSRPSGPLLSRMLNRGLQSLGISLISRLLRSCAPTSRQNMTRRLVRLQCITCRNLLDFGTTAQDIHRNRDMIRRRRPRWTLSQMSFPLGRESHTLSGRMRPPPLANHKGYVDAMRQANPRFLRLALTRRR